MEQSIFEILEPAFNSIKNITLQILVEIEIIVTQCIAFIKLTEFILKFFEKKLDK
jgi:hypothetical protein